MYKVQFLQDTSNPNLTELIGRTVVVYRDGYKLPEISGAEYIEFEKYKATYTKHTPDNIIMVGTNRIFIPANRCDMVYEYLQTMTPHINKISLDTSPFIGEPWRAWFHYSLAFGEWLGYNYSYIVETDWQHWFYRDAETSILDGQQLCPEVKGTFSDLPKLMPTFEFYEPDALLAEYYQEVKKLAFDKYGTPKQLIQFMSKTLNDHLSLDFSFDSFRKSQRFLLPDFGVYRFMAEENERRMETYNCFLR